MGIDNKIKISLKFLKNNKTFSAQEAQESACQFQT